MDVTQLDLEHHEGVICHGELLAVVPLHLPGVPTLREHLAEGGRAAPTADSTMGQGRDQALSLSSSTLLSSCRRARGVT